MLQIFEAEGYLQEILKWSNIHAKKGKEDYQSYPGGCVGYSFAGVSS